jgi:hypothetical protein
MNCPVEIAAILTDIITIGLLHIRTLGWSGNSQRCAIEADHIHNLPYLLINFAPQRLVYYWEAERASFVNQTPRSDLAVLEPLWQRLSPHVEALE